jgi:hypothetical protein
LEDHWLLKAIVAIFGQDFFADIEEFLPLLERGVKLLYSLVKFTAIVLKKIHLLIVGQLGVSLILQVFIHDVQLFIAGPEVLQFLISEVYFLHDVLYLGRHLLDLEVSTDVLQLGHVLPVGYELRVQADGSEILGGWVIEVEIEMRVLDLLLDAVAIGHPQ